MDSKININRLIAGGITGGIAMLAVVFLVHAILLQEEYLTLQEWGTIRSEPNLKGVLYHHLSVIISGIPLCFLYVLARDKAGKGPGTAIKVGVLAWLICLPFIMSLYAFYNAGTFVPVATAMHLLRPATTAEMLAAMVKSRNKRLGAVTEPPPTLDQAGYIDASGEPPEYEMLDPIDPLLFQTPANLNHPPAREEEKDVHMVSVIKNVSNSIPRSRMMIMKYLYYIIKIDLFGMMIHNHRDLSRPPTPSHRSGDHPGISSSNQINIMIFARDVLCSMKTQKTP